MKPETENLLTRAKGNADELLHAIVIALRDNQPRFHLRHLLKAYPRILNRENAFLALIAELRDEATRADRLSDALHLAGEREASLKARLAEAEATIANLRRG